METKKQVYDQDVELFLNIAKVVTMVGSTARSYLSETYAGLCKRGGVHTTLPLPITVHDFRSLVLNPYNRNSLVSLLPQPSIWQRPNRHAIASISQLVAIALLVCRQTRIPEKAKWLSTSNAVAEKYNSSPCNGKTDCLFACINLWSDDWDHTKGLTKANKNSIWTCVVSITVMSSPGNVVCSYSDVIAAGPSKLDDHKMDHNEVIPLLLEEMANMQSTFTEKTYFSSGMKGWFHVYPQLVYVLCDQPAKRAISGLLGGNSSNHACFGYSLNPKLLVKSFAACPSCFECLKRGVRMPDNCPVCYAWELPSKRNHKLLYTNNSKPFKLSMAFLIESWTIAWQKLTTGHSKSHVKQFLNSACVNSQEVGRLFLAYESGLPMPYTPHFWTSCELDDFIEAPMHLTMGVVKAVSNLIHNWAAAIGQEDRFTKSLAGLLQLFREFCRVENYRLSSYKSNSEKHFSGWVADTFRSWLKLMPWFYSIVADQAFEWNPFIPETYEYHSWTVDTLKSFLTTRGRKGVSGLRKAELISIVEE